MACQDNNCAFRKYYSSVFYEPFTRTHAYIRTRIHIMCGTSRPYHLGFVLCMCERPVGEASHGSVNTESAVVSPHNRLVLFRVDSGKGL